MEPTSSGALMRYDTMCRAIAEAHQVDEVKDIRDRAAALEHYARQARNVEAERQCCEIRLRAERKAGELLATMDLMGRPEKVSETPTLSDLGITRDQSSQWQKLADIPDPQFEAALAGPGKPTTSGIIKDSAASLVAKTMHRLQQGGEEITSIADLKEVMREVYREDHPPEAPVPPPVDRADRPPPDHAVLDTFDVVGAIVRHAEQHAPRATAERIDKWTRRMLLDDLPLAIAYLTELETHLAEREAAA